MGRSTILSLAPKLMRLEWIRIQMPNWGTDTDWQNVNCHALANLGPFRTFCDKYVETAGACIFIFNMMCLYVVII